MNVCTAKHLQHLPYVEVHFYCPQAVLTLDFHCGMGISE